jgi:hypothetical protein
VPLPATARHPRCAPWPRSVVRGTVAIAVLRWRPQSAAPRGLGEWLKLNWYYNSVLKPSVRGCSESCGLDVDWRVAELGAW